MMVRRRFSVVRSHCVSLIALAGALTGCTEVNDTDIEWISPSEVRQLAVETEQNPDRMLLVDPRAPREYDAGHIPGARNVALEEIVVKAGRVAPFNQYDRIVVYANDPASMQAKGLAKRFMANSYRDVYVLEGGLTEWVAQGGPVVPSEKK